MDIRKGRKAAFHNLGCRVNSYETEVMRGLLENNGYETVSFDEKADVYIINTCTVTGIADKKSRQMIHRARNLNEDAAVVAVGCYVQAAGEKIYEDGAVDIAIGNDRKGDIVKILEEYFEKRGKESETGGNPDHREEIICGDGGRYGKTEGNMRGRGTIREHGRVFLKVQDGCDRFCSYCIIPYVRGGIKSRRTDDALREAEKFADEGVKEIVITGIHLSSYGRDFGDGTELIDIVEKLHGVEGIERIRLGSLEPRIITPVFLKRLSALPKFCPHFHLSLQSGCDSVLERMNRRYTTEEYMSGCGLIREYFDMAGITTDVIVGFPGETEDEFERTLSFVKRAEFSKIHVFKYSKRAGTKAEKMDGQVSGRVKHERSQRLMEAAGSMQMDFMRKFMGKHVEVLWEEVIEIDRKPYLTGYTKEYIRVAKKIKSGENPDYINKISHVHILNILNCEILLAQNEKMY